MSSPSIGTGNNACDLDLSAILYYSQRNMFHTMSKIADTGLRRRTGDPILLFWRAVSTMIQGRPSEALREFQSLQDKRDLVIAAPTAMIAAHERCRMVDQEAVHELQAKLTIATSSPTITDRAYLFAAIFLWRMNQFDQARQYLKKVIDGSAASMSDGGGGGGSSRSSTTGGATSSNTSGNSSSVSVALAIMGWVDLTCGIESLIARSLTWFDRVLETSPRDLDALMGRLQYLRIQKRHHTTALDISAQIIAYHPSFVPAHIERMYILLEMAAWEQAIDAGQRLTTLSPDNFDTIAVLVLNELCREGSYKTAAGHIAGIFQILQKNEPTNAALFYELARPFVRLSNRQPQVLEQAQQLASKAVDLDSSKSEYKSELGYIYLLAGNIPKAAECFQAAATQNAHDVCALQGIIKCHILKGSYEEAEEQLEFFDAIQSSTMSPETPYLLSLMSKFRTRNTEKQVKHLRDAHSLLRKTIMSTSLGLKFYVLANPDLLLEIARDLLELCPSEPKREGEEMNAVLRTTSEVLEDALRVIPGGADSLFLMGKVKFLMGDATAAQTFAMQCLKLDPSHIKSHILTAQIQLFNSFPKLAMSSLEMALSHNFEVRHIPLFHILKAQALKQQCQLEEALNVLISALQMPIFKENDSRQTPQVRRSDTVPTLSERATLYLELAEICTKLKKMHEATKYLEDAARLFSGTPEHFRVTLANADIMLERGEVDQALALLGAVGPHQPMFMKAKAKMADILLKYKKDKKAYARCYAELVERNRTEENSLLLGDAYMNIQEPEKSIEVYEAALELSPESTILASKIGKALVKTHDYGRAISYYESALAKDSSGASVLKYDLAELYFKLKNYDDAERAITEALNHPRSEDATVIVLDSKLNVLLAKVSRSSCKYDKAISALSRARDLQISLIIQQGANGESKEQKMMASDICFELAEVYHLHQKEPMKALAYYNDAIQYNGMNTKAMISLAKLHFSQNDLNAAQTQCANMLRMELAVDEATMMMADIMFKKSSYSSAVFHFQQLLQKTPTHYHALRKLIEMMRRSGNLHEADKYFEVAEKSSVKVYLHPGYHFCRGLHYRYTNSPNEALREFNLCRRDTEWGEQSLYNMIEIFLNPDNDIVGGDALEAAADNSTEVSGGERQESDFLAVLTVDKLLKELPQTPRSLKTQILECNSWMATKQKPDIERALVQFTEILNTEKEYVPALLGMAVGHMLLKQPPRARNHLKRISKMDWTVELADEFESSWLLLADIHIQGGKFDLATELLKKAIAQNKSCAKAWEYMGYIMEKEASYKDAADHYESAWKLERESNPAMGFKLAFNHLKAKKYVEAIEVCHKVLSGYPDYPKIKKDILEKARTLLRA